VAVLDDAAQMGDAVRLNDYDAGLVLPADFDREIRAGEKPLLELFVSGESLALNRLIIAVTTLDFVRDVEGTVPPVQVEVVDIGREALPLALRLVPIIMMYALLVAGVFVPGSSLVDEKEKGTLSALLVTPVRASEVLLSKALLGTLLAFVMAAATLAMIRALGSRPFELVFVLFVAAGVSATLGLVAGEFAKDSTVLFSIITDDGSIFGDAGSLVRSAAVARLRLEPLQAEGFLALGSRLEAAFRGGQGTELLRFLAGVIERCLLRIVTKET